MAAPRRPLNPLLLHRVDRSGKSKARLAFVAKFPNYPEFYETLRAERVPATPRAVERLQLLADAVGLPRDEIFLDEVAR